MHLPNVLHFNKFFFLFSLGSIGHNWNRALLSIINKWECWLNETFASKEHPQKANEQIEVTLEGIFISFKELQLLKASLPIWIAEEGRVTIVRDVHSLKSFDSTNFIEGRCISLNDEHPEKEEKTIDSICDWNMIFSNDLQPSKASKSIDLIKGGMIIIFNDLQSLKAL